MSLIARFPLIKDAVNVLDPSFSLTGTFTPSTNSLFGGSHTLSNYLYGTIPELINISNFTITFWIYCSSTYIVSEDWIKALSINTKNTENGTTGTLRFECCYNYNPPRAISIHDNTSYDYFQSMSNSVIVSEKDKWHHVAVTADGSIIKCYCDGVLTSTAQEQTGNPQLSGYISIGSEHYNGQMNDLRFYNDALDAFQVKQIAKGLILHYNFGNLPQLNYFTKDDSTDYKTSYTPEQIIDSHIFCGNVIYSLNSFSSAQTFTVSFDLSWSGSTSTNATLGFFQGSVYDATSSSYIWNNEKNYLITALRNKYDLLALTRSSASGKIHCFVSYTIPSEDLISYPKAYLGVRFDNSNGTMTVSLDNIRVVLGDQEGLGEITKSNVSSSNIIYDSSEFGFNGTIRGNNIITSTESKSDSGSIYFNGDPSKSVQCTNFPNLQRITYNVWAKQYVNGSTQFIMSQGRDYNIFGINLFMTQSSYAAAKLGKASQNITPMSNTSIELNTWHMYSITYDGTTYTFYVDGKFVASGSLSNIDYTYSAGLVIGKMSYGYTSNNNYFPFNGLISDPRVYCTALSADDIKSLYQSRKQISKSGSLHCNNFFENSFFSKNSITNKGLQRVKEISEILTLSDGSKWLRLMHHNTKDGTNLFSSTDDFKNSIVYHNSDCWSAFNFLKNINENNTLYEFLVIQQENDVYTKYRWSQSVNPLDATFQQTINANINPILNIPSYCGGIYFKNDRAFLCANDNNSGDWFGFGVSRKYSNGVPGYNHKTIRGFYDLYIRINNNTFKESKAGILFLDNLNNI